MTEDKGPSKKRPLVSLVLYAFNEEKFIREAIDSVFSQDYSPLEIVLSDDGSSDRTFEIMQEMAASYSGPHKIILNKNETNIGIGSQINAAVRKTQGELILLANGDDICLPDRTTKTVAAWLDSEKQVHAIHSDLDCIDESGALLGRRIHTYREFDSLEQGVRSRFRGVLAASLTLSRDVFDRFGPLSANLILEDNPLFLRAFILGLGKTLHLTTPSVHYRVHNSNISQAYAMGEFNEWRQRSLEKVIWHKKEEVRAYLQMLRDLHQQPADAWPEEDLKRARWAGMEKLLEAEILHSYYTNDRTISSLARWKTLVKITSILLKTQVKRVFPFIEKRNERWHFERVRNASENHDS